MDTDNSVVMARGKGGQGVGGSGQRGGMGASVIVSTIKNKLNNKNKTLSRSHFLLKKKDQHWDIIIKLSKVKDKKRILKEARKN